MRLLLDTHVLLWWLADDAALSPVAREAIADEDSEVWVSAASAWEISIKRALGKLSGPNDLVEKLVENHFDPLPILVADALEAGSLPPHHDDPFDRMLVAQARLSGLTLVTHDARIRAYDVVTLSG